MQGVKVCAIAFGLKKPKIMEKAELEQIRMHKS